MEGERVRIKDLDADRLEAFVRELGEPAYRAQQLANWMYRHRAASFAEMSSLPLDLRERLAERAVLTTGAVEEERRAGDGTVKFLIRLTDGRAVESVGIPSEGGLTVCLSSQVGCAQGCVFCATGRMGLVRNLSPAEIVEQVHILQRECGEETPNVVFMGMGEPLANYRAVVRAIRLLNDPRMGGIGVRRITVSTCGLVPGIRRLAGEDLAVRLAVSLHAPTDRVRSRMIPSAARYPLEELVSACHEYFRRTGRRVSFEYLMIGGMNDSRDEARGLVELLEGLTCHVNLIPFNPIPGLDWGPSPPGDVERFRRLLDAAGVPVSVRRSRGREIDAACGQLHTSRDAPGGGREASPKNSEMDGT